MKNIITCILLIDLIFIISYPKIVNCVFPRSCRSPPKFKSKSMRFGFSDSQATVQIELIDICYGLTNGLKISTSYEHIDSNVQVRDDWINFFKASFVKFDIHIDKVLGKGNYGSVFLAKSNYYGKIAVKVATNQDAAFWDPVSKQECCFQSQPHVPCNPCQRRLNELIPFEAATSILTLDAPGVVRSKAFGVISAGNRLLFYVILMEYLENSMTLLSFVQKCFRRFSYKMRLDYISDTERKLNEINKNLIKNYKIFHNDLKSDNILVRVKSSNNGAENCGDGSSKLDVYLIDFGNSILNVNRQNNEGSPILVKNQFKYKKYFLVYRAPEITCQLEYVSMSQILAWYLGVVAFEMCTNGGAGNSIPIGPSPNVCHMISFKQAQNMNSFDSFIKPKPGIQNAFRLCFNKYLANHLRKALVFDPNNRLSSDNLIKLKLMEG